VQRQVEILAGGTSKRLRYVTSTLTVKLTFLRSYLHTGNRLAGGIVDSLPPADDRDGKPHQFKPAGGGGVSIGHAFATNGAKYTAVKHPQITTPSRKQVSHIVEEGWILASGARSPGSV
jgi:hypothetical protein